jgi:hypothetical protein
LTASDTTDMKSSLLDYRGSPVSTQHSVLAGNPPVQLQTSKNIPISVPAPAASLNSISPLYAMLTLE